MLVGPSLAPGDAAVIAIGDEEPGAPDEVGATSPGAPMIFLLAAAMASWALASRISLLIFRFKMAVVDTSGRVEGNVGRRTISATSLRPAILALCSVLS